jgi:zinc protease
MSRIRTILGFALLAWLAVPISAQQPKPSSPPAQAVRKPQGAITEAYTKFTLPNGLTVILHEDHTVPDVTVNVWYHVGSANEKPGRTGFAHLFEHLMFEGSGHVKHGDFDNILEGSGGQNNASTSNDRTNYYIDVPSNALDRALYLESDRMGYLLDVVSEEMVNGQRDVVKNERRQSIENQPYGMAEIRINELIYPKDHPYHWPVVGYMEDLTAASADDVREFFRKYYTPQNASLVVAGDINPVEARKRVEYWFSDVKPAKAPDPITVPTASLPAVVNETLTDRVQLPRLYLVWHTPAFYKPGDAELDMLADILTSGKNSRLYKRLVYDMQVAQSVSATQDSNLLGSTFQIIVTARPSPDAPAVVLDRLKGLIDEELAKLKAAPPDAREVQRAINKRVASFYNRLERVGGFGGVADQMNGYYFATGDPDYFEKDLARYRTMTPAAVQAVVGKWLQPEHRLELSVVPAVPAK